MRIALQALAILALFHVVPVSTTHIATRVKLHTISSIVAASHNARSTITLITLQHVSLVLPIVRCALLSQFAYNAVLDITSSIAPVFRLVLKPTIKVCKPAQIMIIACLAKPIVSLAVLQSIVSFAILVSSNSMGFVSQPAPFSITQSILQTVTVGNVPPIALAASIALIVSIALAAIFTIILVCSNALRLRMRIKVLLAILANLHAATAQANLLVLLALLATSIFMIIVS